MTLLTWSLALLAAAYVLAGVGLAVFQRSLQYFPDRRLTDLAQTGMSGGEELRLRTADGQNISSDDFYLSETVEIVSIIPYVSAWSIIIASSRDARRALRGRGGAFCL